MRSDNNKMLEINKFLERVDNKILGILESSVTHYGKCLWNAEFIFNKKQILGTSLQIDYSQSALDYLASKVKFLFLQTLLFQIRLLEDDLEINKHYLNTDKYVSYMVLDLTNRKMEEITCEEIKEMKYGVSKLDEYNSLNGMQAIFRDYHDKLRNIGKMNLEEYFKKNYKYTIKGSFIDNVEYQYVSSDFLKKDLAFLYAEAKGYSKKVRNKVHYYLDEFSSTNFYYISFLINEFGNKCTVFKCSNNFFSYIIPQKDNKKKSKSNTSHKQHSRDFETMINTYNRHITSANSYLKKLIYFMNQEAITGIDEYDFSNADLISLINFYFLTNNTLRSDFFSSLDSIYVQNILKKIPIEKVYKSLTNDHYNEGEETQHILTGCIHSIDTYIQYIQGLDFESSQLFYLQLLELLMLLNVDTNYLSKLSFYNQKENSNKLSTEERLHLVSDSYELLYIFERIIYDFLSRSYLSILDFLNKGIELFHEIEHDKLFSHTLEVILTEYYNIKFDLDKSEFTTITFNTISNSTCMLYKKKSINEKLIISYLFNACGRNRIINDYFYHLSPYMKDLQMVKKEDEIKNTKIVEDNINENKEISR